MSPAVSKKQQQFFGAELSRKRAGKKTVTGMSEKQLEEFASTPRKKLPKRAKTKKKKKEELGGQEVTKEGKDRGEEGSIGGDPLSL